MISPWLFNVYMYGWCGSRGECLGVGKRWELPSENGGRFELTQLLFADVTALVADSLEKLCRLVSEFVRI